MKRIAITGGIGSGKSTVVKIFNELGIPSIDADEIARQVRNLPSIHAQILKRFGTADRLELREIISKDQKAKADIEAILHPQIKLMSEKKMKALEATSTAPFLLYEATLVIQTGRAKEFDALFLVDASDEERINRIMKRDQISHDAAKTLMIAQMSREEWLKHTDYVIHNSGTLDQLRHDVRKILDQLMKQ